jgi:hypothetical protein
MRKASFSSAPTKPGASSSFQFFSPTRVVDFFPLPDAEGFPPHAGWSANDHPSSGMVTIRRQGGRHPERAR